MSPVNSAPGNPGAELCKESPRVVRRSPVSHSMDSSVVSMNKESGVGLLALVRARVISARLPVRQSWRILPVMSRGEGWSNRFLPRGPAATILLLFVCLCVVSQMLGAPFTLLGLLMSDTPTESLSEDFSIPPITPEPGTPSRFSFHAELQPSLQLAVFPTAVFHPPQG